ncbi:MAG TPA: hypothetical protein VFU16_03285 [Solirubrobacterales bacterium]|nr:hypothetical protein [Solirubrobacterales bacterium]
MGFRKFLLALTIGCVFLGAVAPAASAVSGEFLHSEYPNSAYAESTVNGVLKIDSQSVTCNTEDVNGATQIGPATELVLTPSFTGCTAFGFAGASVNPNGCTYRLTQPAGSADTWNGGFAIKCPAGKKLAISSSAFGSECKAEIGEQTLASGVSYKNETANAGILLTFNLSAIRVTKVTDNGLCPLGGTGTVNNGTYTNNTEAKGAAGGSLAIGVYDDGWFLHSKYSNSAHAVQNESHVFKVDGQSATCKSVELNGTALNGPVTELALTPTYKECTVFGFANSTINPNGCTYRLAQPEGSADSWAGSFRFKCPAGKKLVIEATPFGSTCKVEIGEQTLASGVAYENETAEEVIDLTFSLSGIKSTTAIDNGICPLTGTGERNNSTYAGGSTASAVSGGGMAIDLPGPGEFAYSKYSNSVYADLAGSGQLAVDGQTVTCTVEEFNGATQNGPATELVLTPSFSGCTAFGFAGATIKFSGCTYRLTQPQGFADNWAGGFAIKCPEGKKIAIEVTSGGSTCKVEIGEQTPTGSVTYGNDTAEAGIDLALNLLTIKVTKATDNGSCPLEGTGTVNNATFIGGTEAEAASGGELVIVG